MSGIVEEFIKDVKQKTNENSPFLIPEEVLSVYPIDVDNPTFVPRKRELSALGTGISNCIKGTYKTLVIHGKSGVGKTTLVSLINVAAQNADLKYNVSEYNKILYSSGLDYCYANLIFDLCEYILSINRDTGREMSSVKTHRRYYDLGIAINTKIRSIKKQEILTEAINFGIIKEDVIKNNNDPFLTLVEILVGQLKGHKICLALDDFELLEEEENRLLLQEFKSILKLKNIFSILIMHTNTLVSLAKSNEDLIKNASMIEILPFAPGELIEMLWRRMKVYVGEVKNIKTLSPNYDVELQPFDKDAVFFLANRVEGNPLTFIKLLKETVSKANELNSPSVTLEIAQNIVNSKIIASVALSTRDKQVLEFIRQNGSATIEDIKSLLGKSRILAFFELDKLYSQKILSKERRGREVHYFISSVR